MLRRIALSCLCALVLAAPAGAGTIVIRLTLVPGKLTVKAAQAAASPERAVQVPVTVADGRGSGAGWTLRVTAPRAVSVSGVSVSCAPGSTCTLPRAVRTATGAVVLQAARDSGMGVLDVVVTVAALPAGSVPAPLAFTAS